MTWIKDRLFAFKNIAILIGGFIAFVFVATRVAFRRGRKVGEVVEGAKRDIDNVRKAAAKGDDDGVTDAWRRSRKR